jgi:hypothetical protein
MVYAQSKRIYVCAMDPALSIVKESARLIGPELLVK